MRKLLVSGLTILALYATAQASSAPYTFSPAGYSARFAEEKISPDATYIMAMGVEQAIIEYDGL
jgi:hypothetical protein